MSRRFTLLSRRWLLPAVVAVCVTSHAFAQTPVRIMPLGDSITAAPGCWRAYLWNRLQTAGFTNIDFVGGVNNGDGCGPGFTYDFDHEGHSGFSITGIADQNQLPPWLTAARPDVVVVHLGTNDMWGGFIPLQNKITALTKLIGQMRANNPNMKIVVAKIIPMSPPDCPTCAPDVVASNNALPAWAAGLTTAQSPILLADVWTGFDGGGHLRPCTRSLRLHQDGQQLFPGGVTDSALHFARPDRHEVGPERHRHHARRHQLRRYLQRRVRQRHVGHAPAARPAHSRAGAGVHRHGSLHGHDDGARP
jgi:lysophospholipase L1-like esterase